MTTTAVLRKPTFSGGIKMEHRAKILQCNKNVIKGSSGFSHFFRDIKDVFIDLLERLPSKTIRFCT